jgi:hypothetical protein
VAKIKAAEVDVRHVGWIRCPIEKADGVAVLKIELKGPDNR